MQDIYLGFREHIWEVYEEMFIKRIVRTCPDTAKKEMYKELAWLEGYPNLIYGLSRPLALRMNHAVEDWEREHQDLPSLRRLRVSECEQQTQSLLHTVKAAIHAGLEDFRGHCSRRYEEMHTYEEEHPGWSKQSMDFIVDVRYRTTHTLTPLLQARRRPIT